MKAEEEEEGDNVNTSFESKQNYAQHAMLIIGKLHSTG